jgi:hypothetical protein
MRVLESACTLVSTKNASTEYASTENVGTKVLSQDDANTEYTGTDKADSIRSSVEMHGNASTVDGPGKRE